MFGFELFTIHNFIHRQFVILCRLMILQKLISQLSLKTALFKYCKLNKIQMSNVNLCDLLIFTNVNLSF
ncbi:hypothetical protein CRS_09350 [Chryseobacterium sp. ON_d1]|nr:hypothetical protein CRS_09350 [Chryseobacterium sp. ON_d1]